MSELEKRSKTQILKEIQETVELFLEKKQLVELLLVEIEELEMKYNYLKQEAKRK